jgi:hypothetical protein
MRVETVNAVKASKRINYNFCIQKALLAYLKKRKIIGKNITSPPKDHS